MANIRWTKSAIVDRIQAYRREGKPLSYGQMVKADHKLVGAAIRHFGSWRRAIETAGISYENILQHSRRSRAAKLTKWTKDRVLQEIRRLRREGEGLNYIAVKRKYLPLLTAACLPRHFGSWRIAIEAAGIPYHEVQKTARSQASAHRSWQRQLVLEQLRFLKSQGVDLGEEAALKQFPTLVEVAQRVFGSWLTVLERALRPSDTK